MAADRKIVKYTVHLVKRYEKGKINIKQKD